jgi:hypothetical protein
MNKDNLTQTLKQFNRGDRLSLAQLKYLIKHLWIKYHEATDLIHKQKWKDKVEEVQVDIDYWTEIEKVHPFASFEKYVK